MMRMFENRKIFTDDEARWIHKNALEILEKTGMDIAEKQARDDFAKAGCRVDETQHRVYMPQYLVEEALRTTPSKFSFYDSY